MNEKQSPAPEEIRQKSTEGTPKKEKERKLTLANRAREDLLTHKKALETAGVDPETIAKAAELTFRQKIEEYEKKEKQDPAYLFLEALKNAAPEDKNLKEKILTTATKELQSFAGELLQLARDYRNKVKHKTGPFTEQEMRAALEKDSRLKKGSGEQAYLQLQTVENNDWPDDQSKKQFYEKLLHAVGTLKTHQTLNNLEELPSRQQQRRVDPNGAFANINRGLFGDLYTNIPGVRLSLNLSKLRDNHGVYLSFDVPAMTRLANQENI